MTRFGLVDQGKIKWWRVGPILVVIAAVVLGSSIWRHQVGAEEAAQGSYINARVALRAEIAHAQRIGLDASTLARYRARLDSATNRTAPKDSTFWDNSRSGYFRTAATDLNHMRARLDNLVHTELHTSRNTAEQSVRSLQLTVVRGQSQGMLLSTAMARLKELRAILAKSPVRLSAYQVVADLATRQVRSAAPSVRQRRETLREILSTSGNRHRRTAIRTKIQALVERIDTQIARLKIFDSQETFSRWLQQLYPWAIQRPTARATAIGMADIEQMHAALKARAAKVMPAKWILVSTEGEWIEWFQGTSRLGFSLATTGNPQLPTVKGHFTIFAKFSPFEFVSDEPKTSPFWYAPSPVSYAMEFQNEGYFIHDAPWRSVFGPGSDGPGQPGTNYGGTHGCVNVPFDVAQTLYGWAPIGTAVVVV
jgi:hypothetical protein